MFVRKFSHFISLVVFLLILIPANSQTSKNSGVVQYGVKLMYNPIDSLQKKLSSPDAEKRMRQEFESLKPALHRLTYNLKFNENKALFSVQDFMNNDNEKINLDKAVSISNSKGVFYVDIEKNLNLRLEKLGDKVFLVKNKNYKWKLTNESKIIAGYPCKKAVAKIKINPTFTETVEAWYCPSITHNFGPKGYYGLPGLILGLEEHGFYFYVKNIKLEKKNINIEQPKGQIITKKEYYKELDRYYSNN